MERDSPLAHQIQIYETGYGGTFSLANEDPGGLMRGEGLCEVGGGVGPEGIGPDLLRPEGLELGFDLGPGEGKVSYLSGEGVNFGAQFQRDQETDAGPGGIARESPECDLHWALGSHQRPK
ncbi:hypothetical protein Ancab_005172 [Ancistrocladus abbreviatus]